MRFEVGRYYKHKKWYDRVHVLGYLPKAIFNGDKNNDYQILVAETMYGRLIRLKNSDTDNYIEDAPWKVVDGKVIPATIQKDEEFS